MRLLDLFCGAGGMTKGLQRAGFYVVGVDKEPQPNYCGDEFVQDDALALLSTHPWWDVAPFDAIHASPPCQGRTTLKATNRHMEHEDLVEPTRELLEATGLPYVIENVEGDMSDSPLINPITICGSMFDPVMDVKRHRLFEANWPLQPPVWPCRHKLWTPRYDVYEHGKWRKARTVPVYGSGGRKAKEHWAKAMGIDWMTHDEMALAIPPAYGEFVGEQLMRHLQMQVAA